MITVKKKNLIDIFIFLPVIAVCIDLFTPYLIWKNVLPSEIRWGSHAMLAAIIFVSLLRMLALDSIPNSFWMIAFISIFWSYIAIGHGQELKPTIWGVWLLFQFPFVGLFMCLQSGSPQRLSEYLRTFSLIVLGMELIVQLIQFASGVIPGDDLSGLFGKNGTGNVVLFDILVCCIFFGYWIASKRSAGLVITLTMSTFSSVLGEMKLFLPVITVIGLIAVFLYAVKYHAPGKMVLYLTMLFIILLSFIYLYNIIIPGAHNVPIQEYITNSIKLLNYLNGADTYVSEENTLYDIGRGYAVSLGWNSLQKDPITFLFGYGLGTRSESQSLGTAGIALTTGDLGLSVGTSLLVMMQELGFVGLVLLISFWLWLLISLIRNIQMHPDSPATGLRYALFLFSILWPIWLWYGTTWTMRVPMLLYWVSVGYVFAESRLAHSSMKHMHPRMIKVES